MKPSTSSTATGSFRPDSPSSVRASLRDNVEPRSSAKIAAPSVEDKIAPNRRPSWIENPKSAAAEMPTSSAVIAVPTVANDVEAPRTGGRCGRPLVSPPASRLVGAADSGVSAGAASHAVSGVKLECPDDCTLFRRWVFARRITRCIDAGEWLRDRGAECPYERRKGGRAGVLEVLPWCRE